MAELMTEKSRKPEAEDVKKYSTLTVIIGYLTAMTCLCGIFEGSILDIVAADLITVVLFWIIRLLNKPNLNHIIVNVLTMWIAGTLAVLLIRIGIAANCGLTLLGMS